MRSRAAGGDQLVADPPWKRKVSDPIAVQVPELAPSDRELHAAKAMLSDADARPRGNGVGNLGARTALLLA